MQERHTISETTADSDQHISHSHPDHRDALCFIAELASHYELTAIEPLLQVCQSAARKTDLNIAVLGRFKAGKSSFLNHFTGRDLFACWCRSRDLGDNRTDVGASGHGRGPLPG
jgi:tRNA U34 5-carboxymethylaminomethyl modifying GTPase MnmE/TrmE